MHKITISLFENPIPSYLFKPNIKVQRMFQRNIKLEYTYPLGKTFSAKIFRKAFGAVRSTCMTGMVGGDREKRQIYYHPPNSYLNLLFSNPLIYQLHPLQNRGYRSQAIPSVFKRPTMYGVKTCKRIKQKNPQVLESSLTLKAPEKLKYYQQSLTLLYSSNEGKAAKGLFFITPPPIKTSWLQAWIKSCFPN